MSDTESRLDPDLDSFESALGGLVPAVPHIARDRLLFEAGRASAGRERVSHSWKKWGMAALAVISTAAALFLAVRLRQQSDTLAVVKNDLAVLHDAKRPNVGEAIADSALPTADTAVGEPGGPPSALAGNYLQIRGAMLSGSFDSFAPPVYSSESGPPALRAFTRSADDWQ